MHMLQEDVKLTAREHFFRQHTNAANIMRKYIYQPFLKPLIQICSVLIPQTIMSENSLEIVRE